MIYYICYILRFFFKVFFWRKTYGRKNFPEGAALIACNHQSYLDPLVVGSAAPEKIVYMTRRSLAKNRLAEWFLAQCNTVLITRGEPELSAFKKILHRLENGKKVLVFPEGRRSPTGELMPPKKRLGLLVNKTRVPVIPVYIYGTHHAMPRGRSFILPAKIIVAFGEPIYFDEILESGNKKQVYTEIGRIVMARIAELRNFCLSRL